MEQELIVRSCYQRWKNEWAIIGCYPDVSNHLAVKETVEGAPIVGATVGFSRQSRSLHPASLPAHTCFLSTRRTVGICVDGPHCQRTTLRWGRREPSAEPQPTAYRRHPYLTELEVCTIGCEPGQSVVGKHDRSLATGLIANLHKADRVATTCCARGIADGDGQVTTLIRSGSLSKGVVLRVEPDDTAISVTQR